MVAGGIESVSKIRDALSVLPARPALFIAPLLVVLVLSLYYRDQYQKCVDIRETRVKLTAHVRSMSPGDLFRLTDFTDFDWNKVRIVASVEPGTISESCPFDWNWPAGERDALLAEGLLSALIFGQDGKVVGYFELRADEVLFPEAKGNLTRNDAAFRVDANPAAHGAIGLRFQPASS